MKTRGTPFLRLALKGICRLAVPLALAAPAVAGVVNGVSTVDGLTVYLGVVPAAVTLCWRAARTSALAACTRLL